MMNESQVSVIIPSFARPQVLEETVWSVLRQIIPPYEIIVSVVSQFDVSPATQSLPSVRVLYGTRGSTAQRNIAVAAVDQRSGFILFLDDDVELTPQYIESCLAAMSSRQDAVVLAGTFIQDDVTRGQARSLVAKFSADLPDPELFDVPLAPGGNMFVRAWVARKVEFDENLALYGWLEDADWSARAARYGKIVCSARSAMVHLHVVTGRVSPRQFGYAQVVNPYYLWKKGSIGSVWEVLRRHWTRGVPHNLGGCIIDSGHRAYRAGRLQGNIIGFWEILRGNPDPARILDL
jgi:GT2 family glycosyltransferase